jgi:hypothetical protein
MRWLSCACGRTRLESKKEMPVSIYLVAAYAVFWGLTFLLVISIWARQRRLEQKIAALQSHLEENEE